MSQTTEPSRRFAGMNRLYGDGATERLAQAHVCVVGVGGVGSWAVEALARCGVGTLTLIDADHVVESNVNRQIQAVTDNLGKAKITALRERIAQINPDCAVHEVDDFIDADTLALLPATADVVLDCTDQVKAKLAMIAFCKQRRQKLLTCGAAGGKTDATRIVQSDLAYSIQDPILAKIRQQLRRESRSLRSSHAGAVQKPKKPVKMDVPVLYSDEAVRYPVVSASVCAVGDAPVAAAPQGLNCAGFGSSVMVTASFGMAAAQWAVVQILDMKKAR
jgi:tRNA A37 threonylcarbamoyladenosine dehydratase